MFKYYFCFVYTNGHSQYSHHVNRYLTLDHEITEADIENFKKVVAKEVNQDFVQVNSLTRISSL